MARVLNPLMSVDASGSVGGVQFSKNRSGSFGSRKSTSTRAQGDRVLEYRSQLARAHHHFDTFTDAEKASWDLTPDTHVKPREHYLKLHLMRAARGLTIGHTYPGDRGRCQLLFLVVNRQMAPGTFISTTWLSALPVPGYVDFTARPTYLASFDGHPRKFTWQTIAPITDEAEEWHLHPYARFLTLHLLVRDYYTLRIYDRWVFHYDDNVRISVTPEMP